MSQHTYGESEEEKKNPTAVLLRIDQIKDFNLIFIEQIRDSSRLKANH